MIDISDIPELYDLRIRSVIDEFNWYNAGEILQSTRTTHFRDKEQLIRLLRAIRHNTIDLDIVPNSTDKKRIYVLLDILELEIPNLVYKIYAIQLLSLVDNRILYSIPFYLPHNKDVRAIFLRFIDEHFVAVKYPKIKKNIKNSSGP